MAEPPENKTELGLPARQTVLRVLEDLVGSIPASGELASDVPLDRAREIVRAAGLKAGAVLAGLALPPGPAGMLTVIPDLIKVWHIQRQMVSDIAACFGKSAQLNRQMMVYCLFRHGAAMLALDILFRVGERLVLKQGSLRVIQRELERVTIKTTQKAIGRSISRWVPVVGPAVVGGYSLLDTRSVGKTAIETFSRVIEDEADEEP